VITFKETRRIQGRDKEVENVFTQVVREGPAAGQVTF
jgi:hypothetical protein